MYSSQGIRKRRRKKWQRRKTADGDGGKNTPRNCAKVSRKRRSQGLNVPMFVRRSARVCLVDYARYTLGYPGAKRGCISHMRVDFTGIDTRVHVTGVDTRVHLTGVDTRVLATGVNARVRITRVHPEYLPYLTLSLLILQFFSTLIPSAFSPERLLQFVKVITRS